MIWQHIYFARESGGEVVMSTSVCLCVCLSASISPEPQARSLLKFLRILPMAVAQSSLLRGDKIPRQGGSFVGFPPS